MSKSEKMIAFENHRSHLFDILQKGDIDKTEYIYRNHEFFNKEESHPYTEINTVEECLYNYQYYNTKAKFAKMKSMELKYKDPFVAVDFRKEADKLYFQKERIAERLIELTNPKDIEAYYIKVSSKSLNGKIFEIVFKELDQVILHSMDKSIQKKLRDMGRFDKRARKSIIDHYINSLY